MSKPLTAKQRYWQNHLSNAQQFDGSVAAYARSQGLTPKKLYQWQHLLSKRAECGDDAAVFSKVVSTEVSLPIEREPALIISIKDIELRFNSLPDPQWLTEWQRLHGRLS